MEKALAVLYSPKSLLVFYGIMRPMARKNMNMTF